MMMYDAASVGILGTGAFLPAEIRENDWWPEETVTSWRGKLAGLLASVRRSDDIPETPGTRAVAAALERLVDDPFQGAVRRHVMADEMLPSDMETLAAREAIAEADIDPATIDILLSVSLVPDYIDVNGAAVVHHKLGLHGHCIPLVADAICNSFVAQWVLAGTMITTGQARCALLVQSSAASRIIDRTEPYSAWLGDGATAVVIGPVTRGHGLLEYRWLTESEACCTLVTGVPGQHWYADGATMAFMRDKREARKMVFSTADVGHEVITGALARADCIPDAVNLYVSHQSSAWIRPVTQAFAGLERARSVDIFANTGSLSGSNIPLQLHLAHRGGLLDGGDLVVMFGQASGTTSVGAVARWGQ